MDWLYSLNLIFFNWLPWLNFFNDIFLLQFLIIYNLYIIYFTNNLDLFTAFLWLTECVIIFVSIIFLFYFNIYSNTNNLNINIYSFKYFGVYICVFILSFIYIFDNEFEFYLPIEFDFFYNWDDFYESLNNNKYNDLYCLFISYYYINSFEFIIIGLILLFASIICVNLNKFNKNIKFNNYYDFLILFDFFNDFVNYNFLRKQNLNDQTLANSSIKFFKKKQKIQFDSKK